MANVLEEEKILPGEITTKEDAIKLA